VTVCIAEEVRTIGSEMYKILKTDAYAEFTSSNCPFKLKERKKYRIMERFDQSSLHLLIMHPETDMSQPGMKPRLPVSQAGTLPKS
jgi:hypothetical protein